MLAAPLEVLVGTPMPDRSKVRGQTKSNLPALQVWGFCIGLTTLSCKKAFVTETATCNLQESSVQKEPPESMPWATVNAESENTRNSAGNRIRITDSGQSRKEAAVMTMSAVSAKTTTLIEGKRKRGRPKITWRRTVEKEIKEMGKTWEGIKFMARDRQMWREHVAALHAC